MKSYTVTPVATVIGGRVRPIDDNWGAVTAIVRVDQERFDADALAGLEEFSHLEVVYTFHLEDPAGIERGARRPRNDPRWPRAGIFAQRARDRPNRIRVSRCRITRVSGLDVHAEGLDAVDGTPVLDIKPHMSEFDRPGTSGRASLNASAVPQTPASDLPGAVHASTGAGESGAVPILRLFFESSRGAGGRSGPRRRPTYTLPRISSTLSARPSPRYLGSHWRSRRCMHRSHRSGALRRTRISQSKLRSCSSTWSRIIRCPTRTSALGC